MRWLIVFFLIMNCNIAVSSTVNDLNNDADNEFVTLYLSDIPANEVVGLLYREVYLKPFVTSPEVQAKRDIISLHLVGSRSEVRKKASDYLSAFGFEIVRGDEVDRIEIFKPKVIEKPEPVFVNRRYLPRNQSADDIIRIGKELFPDFKISTVGGGNSILIYGDEKNIDDVLAVLRESDEKPTDLIIKAVVFEVGSENIDGSALKLVTEVMGGKFNVGLNPSANVLSGGYISFGNSSVEAIVSMLSTDSRFNLVTTPVIRGRSGSESSFSVGQSVPTLSSVSYPEGGGSTPVQSVTYRDAGVIFKVKPIVQADVISLSLNQEISDFVKTTTGVNNTPTLTKRSLDSVLSLKDGDVVMLGGLTKTKDENNREGFSFLPDFLKQKRNSVSRSDILLILQVQRVGKKDADFFKRPVQSSKVLNAIERGKNGLY